MNNLRERETKLLEVKTPTPTGWVNLLTGKPVYKEEMGKCPSCGANAVISDYPSLERCLKCGWNND